MTDPRDMAAARIAEHVKMGWYDPEARRDLKFLLDERQRLQKENAELADRLRMARGNGKQWQSR